MVRRARFGPWAVVCQPLIYIIKSRGGEAAINTKERENVLFCAFFCTA